MTALAQISDRRMRVDRRTKGGRHVEEIETALKEGRVGILFQPQFSCADGSLVGAEALSRWHHPQLGQIGIDSLFDSAMRAGQAARLTRHIAERALAMAAGWPDNLRLSLNITAMDLAEEDFSATILAAVKSAGFDPTRLMLEITEQALVSDIDLGAQRLAVLADAGIRIALDDFGAGFCNFRYLKRLPLHAIKLDRSMIEGVTEDQRDLAVLRGIVALADALGLSVTAEGVETEAQRFIAAREGCSVWQGFLGSGPMPSSEFARLAGA
ncbi:EAL domain-containing protein [Altererythrobacter salegens]|uniref:EAL domain-containing protein n=1 Tax=Croceibacterium salegens TaxID=1737568 RepID=A0A6I4T1J7_9SPHN|nr:EAL domain-containing protein [Croceibacterium salegens]MXO61348.1 EAL domain-containing protein [Croceibacterium salegens]